MRSDSCPQDSLTVLFDGACPLCRREISVYQGLTPSEPVQWADVSDARTPLPPGTERASLLARFHVRRANGELLSGAAAFVALWDSLPGWRWIARGSRIPGVLQVLELMYRGFLRVRPAMQRVARALDTPKIPPARVADLRSDHAGETGAVWIYRGILCIARDPGVRQFALRHLATEQDHLAQIAAILPPARRSWLLPAWRVSGFLTGALPALFSPRAVYTTIAAIETFVDQHYQEQIHALQGGAGPAELLALLQRCQADECHHRDEAQSRQGSAPGALLRGWCRVVGAGSQIAVGWARRL